jgi:hypothetical protein
MTYVGPWTPYRSGKFDPSEPLPRWESPSTGYGLGFGPETGRSGQFAGWVTEARRRMTTPQGFAEAGQEMLSRSKDYLDNFASPVADPGMIRGLKGGLNVPFTGAKVPGSRFAGQKMAKAINASKGLRQAINVIPGLNLIGDIFDVGEAIVGVARKDKVRQGQARDLAQQMARTGMSLDDALAKIEYKGGELEGLVGNQGLDDFGKTLAYGAWTGLPSLNPIAGVAGLITAGDLQWEKHRRNQIFKEEFRRAQGLP